MGGMFGLVVVQPHEGEDHEALVQAHVEPDQRKKTIISKPDIPCIMLVPGAYR